MHGTKPLIFDR